MPGKAPIICAVLVFSLAAFACNIPAFNSAAWQNRLTPTRALETPLPTSTTLDATAIAETVIAQITQSATPGTGTPKATNTKTIIATVTNEVEHCNWAAFISDVSYPDDSQVTAGQGFVKTWQMQNLGTCTWTSAYYLVFDQGDQMNAPAEVKLTNAAVALGETVNISVNLKAPVDPGTYQGFFKMKAPDGSIFGIGPQADGSFWVRIQVVSNEPTTVAPAGADIDLRVPSFSVNPSNPALGAPVTVAYTVKNKGNTPSGHFKVGWWSGEGGADPQCTWDIPLLSANQTIGPLSCNYSYKKIGTYNSQLVIDSGDENAETNESNNSEVAVVTVHLVLAPVTLKIPQP